MFGRIYLYWERMTGGNPYWYQENLCHFVRVLIFWTPLAWFTKHRLFKTDIKPWMVVSALLFAATLILSRDFRLTVAVIIGVLLAILGTVAIVYIIDKIYNGSPRLQRLGRFLEEAWFWFWEKRFAPFIYPWTLTLALLNVSLQFGYLFGSRF
ncbi:hypothetical protein A3D01_03045 [Candidatus Woesebacteria bacterium RIFCSPHIGHO2_02_FULL_39_13]|uniref:Uncharacterized protein n=1 Tax=Candidatus Woesebacteria bacterium RIFCSPHIGHO2_02_FULL_39_13 TaxID=1802505 RepID=A0A1F7Z4D6_9BACT|nr:MAG: hypothetical protein A3D01_03045 [Candidatus Woesebacteria bacterium RIFCSPHIGHO2_02_FULL_39_13]OGM72029.1 MAG: hypothetical protein A3H19_04250 [Candidatus Woesebacteria bacterium RIFCSPLOWO2_12_FULL_39_9]